VDVPTVADAGSSWRRRRSVAGAGAASACTSDALSWFGLAVVPIVVWLGTAGHLTLALRVVALTSLVGGIAIFLTHGGRRVTAAGIYCVALAVMTGSGCLYWATRVPAATTREAVLLVAVGIYTATAITYFLFWQRSLRGQPAAASFPAIPAPLARGASVTGVAIFVLGAASEIAFGTLGSATAEIGLVIFASALVLSGSIRVLGSPLRTVILACALVTFYLVVFSGYGRLRLAALCLVILVMAQYRIRTRVKSVAVVAIVPVLLFFGAIGESRFEAKAVDPTAEATASGLGSLVNPLSTFAQFVDRDLGLGYGSTFLAQLVALVPRALWQDKPVQFGAVVVSELRPDQVSTNLSMPCLAQCEWYYNFSWVGFLLAIPVLGYMVRRLDITLARRCTSPILEWHQLLVLVLVATLIGSIGDLAWGGTATWLVRNAQRILVLAPLLAWAYVTRRRPRVSKRVRRAAGRARHPPAPSVDLKA